MPQDDFDSPWKEALVKYLPRFFGFFFPEIFENVDWEKKPCFLDKELRAIAPARSGNKRGGSRVVDALVEVKRVTGDSTWVLVHIEIQSQRVSSFEKRMLLYHTRLFERYGKPVCSLAILADKNSRWRPERYEHRIWGTVLRFRFSTSKLLDFRDRMPGLETSTNPFALLTAATLHAQSSKQDSRNRDAAKWRMARGLYRAGLAKQEIRGFFRLIDWVLKLTPELEEKFWKRLEQLEKETNMPYITSVERIGIEKGRAEGLRLAIAGVLETRFGEVPQTVGEQLQGIVDEAQLKALCNMAASTESLEAFRGEL